MTDTQTIEHAQTTRQVQVTRLRAAAPITGVGNPTRVTSNALANFMPLTHLNEKNSRLARIERIKDVRQS